MICIISSIVGYGQIQKIQIQKQFATRRLVQAKKPESEAREATVTGRDQRTGSKIYNWKNKPKALTQTCRLDVGLQTTSYSPFAETMRLSLPLSRYSELLNNLLRKSHFPTTCIWRRRWGNPIEISPILLT